MKKNELEHIESEYQKTFTFYLTALKSRREYLCWFTLFYSLIITITAFLWKFELKDLAYLVIILSLFVSFSVMNEIVGTSKTILFLAERISKIQTKLDEEYPQTMRTIQKFSSNVLNVNKRYRKVPFFTLRIGYILTILMSFISMCTSFLIGLYLIEINFKPVCFWTISLLTYILIFICLRIFAVISLGSFINKLKFNKNENSDKKTNDKPKSKKD